MERGAAFRRPRRAHGACSHTAGRAVPHQIALAASNPKPPPPVFAAAGVLGAPASRIPGGVPAPAMEREPLHAVEARRPQKEITPHRARFARDCGE